MGLGFPHGEPFSLHNEKLTGEFSESPPMTWCQHNDISLWGGWEEGEGGFVGCVGQEATALPVSVEEL